MLKRIWPILLLVISTSCVEKTTSSDEDVFKQLSGESDQASRVVIEDTPDSSVQEDILNPTPFSEIPDEKIEIYEKAYLEAEKEFLDGKLYKDILYIQDNKNHFEDMANRFESMSLAEIGISKTASLYTLLIKFADKRSIALKYYQDLLDDEELRLIAAFIYLENRFEF